MGAKKSAAAVVRAGENVSAHEWARIFGTPEQIAARRAATIEEQKKAEVEANENLLRTVKPAIFDDRPYGVHGLYSDCLGFRVNSRTHAKEICKRHNFVQTN